MFPCCTLERPWVPPECGDPVDSTLRLPAESLCIVGSELLSLLGDWKSLLCFCWTGPGDCFPSKAIGGTSVGSFAKIPRQNPRVQGHFHQVPTFPFHRNFFFFKPSSQHASNGHVPSFLDHYSEVLQLYSFPIWPWLAPIKLCYVFCKA